MCVFAAAAVVGVLVLVLLLLVLVLVVLVLVVAVVVHRWIEIRVHAAPAGGRSHRPTPPC